MWNCPYSNDSFPTYAGDTHLSCGCVQRLCDVSHYPPPTGPTDAETCARMCCVPASVCSMYAAALGPCGNVLHSHTFADQCGRLRHGARVCAWQPQCTQLIMMIDLNDRRTYIAAVLQCLSCIRGHGPSCLWRLVPRRSCANCRMCPCSPLTSCCPCIYLPCCCQPSLRCRGHRWWRKSLHSYAV